MNYYLYARKSSESEDQQVQSIDDQVNLLTEMAKKKGIRISKVFTEAKSAKNPDNRLQFEKMMRDIEKNKAEAILCWHINRLSRNPIDSGRISWLLQKGVIKEIQTIDRRYLPEDNVLLFNVESGMANQYIRDLSRNVKRGLQSKAEKGWKPGLPPLGYKNRISDHTIVKDNNCFDLIKRMWSLMLTGCYTPPKILEIANKQWGLRTRRHKRIGDVKLSKSGIYRIFTNPFYSGCYQYKGQHYEGKHEAMITLEEFDRVQVLLGRKGKPRPKTHHFPFTGMIRCGECDCMITAETKQKFIKSTKEVREYTYYHCTRKKQDVECSQRQCIREEELESQIVQELEKYEILPEFRDWALDVLKEKNDQEITERQKIYESQHKDLVKAQRELDNLTKMRYRELIDDDTFLQEKKELTDNIFKMKQQLRNTENRAEEWHNLTEKAFNFATCARGAFVNGDLQTKKEIVTALGSNPKLKDGKFSIDACKWLQPIKNDYPPLEEEYLRLEPLIRPMDIIKTEALASVRTRWLGRRDSNPRITGSKPVALPLGYSPLISIYE